MINARSRRLIAIGLLLLVCVAAAAQNPFTQAPAPDSPTIYGGRVPEFIRSWSRSLQENIAMLSRRVSGGEWTAALTAFGLAVVFGMVHIAGPGHGKMFAISYFSGRDARLRQGIAYSAIANAVDSISAFALVMLGYVVLRAVLPQFRAEGPRILQIISYAIVTLFGILHLLSHLRTSGHNHSHDGHSHHDHAEQSADERKARPAWMLAVSVGLVPCPVSTILIVYGIANGVLPLMILMVIGVSIGGFIVMSVMSGAVILGRTKLMGALDAGAAHTVSAILEYTASGAIIVVGILLLVGSL